MKQARHFFDQRGVVEVDCPILSPSASIDTHIDLIPATYSKKKQIYLHSSPEFGMKRLLAHGIGDIYQMSHVFRDGEHGIKHNPEFMMVEWYRIGMTLDQLMEETADFIRLFLGPLPLAKIRYREAFLKYVGIDYVTSSEKDLLKFIRSNKIPVYSSLELEDKDAMLNLLIGSLVEPHLGEEGLVVLMDYPASQAALAKKKWVDDEQVAERFEIYYHGIELANGYFELTNPEEQEQRFLEGNKARIGLGKDALPIDRFFLDALKRGVPNCSGVAVGFDRLMMLRHRTDSIADVLSWSWEEA